MDKATTLLTELLQQQLQQAHEQNQQLLLQNEGLQSLIRQLQQQIEQLLRQLYGKRSEKNKAASSQEDESSDTTKEASVKATAKNSGLKKGPKRNPLPEHLWREEVKLELTEQERVCKACGHMACAIGCETSEQLEYIPARLYVKRFVRYKYACPCKGAGVLLAPMPAQPIDKGIAGPGLLADVLISKYQDAMPLYRQAMRFKRHGVDIPESTLCDWVNYAATWLAPIVATMKADLLMSHKLHTDDTPIPVLAKGKTTTARLWVYLADGSSNTPACTVYDFTSTRSAQGPAHFLANYQGYLQADAYPGYARLYQTGHIKEVGCWAHARRKFFDITQLLKGAPSDAHTALTYIAKLYHIERHALAVVPLARYFYRRRYAKPILQRFRRWLVRKQRQHLPKSPIAQAVNYVLSNWHALTCYLTRPYLSIDNNAAERAIKPLVIGRKNYLFCGSAEGGRRAAIIYSIIQTCKQHDINAFDYLRDVLTRLPTHKQSHIRELLPYHWVSANN